jgi:hypothetical protein
MHITAPIAQPWVRFSVCDRKANPPQKPQNFPQSKSIRKPTSQYKCPPLPLFSQEGQ